MNPRVGEVSGSLRNMNTFIVFKEIDGTVFVKVQRKEGNITKTRNLTPEEMKALDGLLNEQEFEQHLNQDSF